MLVLSFALPIGLGIGFGSDVLSMCASVVSAVVSLLFTKAKLEACFLVFVSSALYVAVTWRAKLFGDVGYYLIGIIPVQVYTLISWLKHKSTSKDTVNIANVNKREVLLIILSQVVLSMPYYFILQALGSKHLITSTFAMVVGIIAPILQARRYFVFYIFWILKDFASISIWILTLVTINTPDVPPMLTLAFLFLIFDCYGIISWLRIKQRQNYKDNQNTLQQGQVDIIAQ